MIVFWGAAEVNFCKLNVKPEIFCAFVAQKDHDWNFSSGVLEFNGCSPIPECVERYFSEFFYACFCDSVLSHDSEGFAGDSFVLVDKDFFLMVWQAF